MHSAEEAISFVEAFVAEPFSQDPRHERRIAQLASYEDTGALPPLPE
jgi:ribose 5-phosphate isomerase B